MDNERTERHLAAILVADVVGYSRLMQLDESGTFERLRTHRKELFEPTIERFHGRIFKLTGDGLLAEFVSVVDTVECAVAIQQGMSTRNVGIPDDQRIELRMAVNLGDVIVEGDDRHGDGVNIAARLQVLADPGGIVVSRTVAEQLKNKVDLNFESLGEHRLKNIASPVKVYRISPGTRQSATVKVNGKSGNWLWLAGIGAAVIAASVGALLWGFLVPRHPSSTATAPPEFALAGAPSLAVMPFKNMTGNPALEYFADGVTETLIEGLSRSPEIRVVARTSSDAYKNKAQDIRQIGKDLGAHYLLEGSVQKGGNKVRIVAQLIDATTGVHVWADRYDRESSDALALQDEVTEKIIVTIAGDEGSIKKADYENAWGKDHASLEEYDYYLRGHQLFYRFTKDDTLKSIENDREGLAKFPDSALLHISRGWGHYQLVYGGWSTDVAGDYRRAFEFGQQGLSRNNVPPLARMLGHFLMAYLQAEYKGDWDRAMHERELTLALAPNDPVVVASMSEIAIRAGRPDDAIASLTRDLLWDRNYEFGSPDMRLGWAYFVKGEYKTALNHLQQNRISDPVWDLPILAATYAELNMMAEAQAVVAKIRDANPAVSLALLAQVFSYRDPSIQQRFLAALQKSGLPE